MKRCGKCNVVKPKSDFHKGAATIDGLAWQCKGCAHEYYLSYRTLKLKKIDKYQCRMCELHLDPSDFGKTTTYCRSCMRKIGNRHNLKRLGLSVEQYIALERAQNGLCAICKNPEGQKKRLSIDHDHACCPGQDACGKCVRGLLCSRCNKMLGMAKDDINVLQQAIDYLNNT